MPTVEFLERHVVAFAEQLGFDRPGQSERENLVARAVRLVDRRLTDDRRGRPVKPSRVHEQVGEQVPVRHSEGYSVGSAIRESGESDVGRIDPVLSAMTAHNMPLLVHGEVTDPGVDVFDREPVFLERELAGVLERHPKLKVVLEHVTTQEAVEFVRSAPGEVAATITAHHLLFNRNAMFRGGIRPHYYCLPMLKRERHRQALLTAATSGDRCFFLGTDSAPHASSAKESQCGCAGIFTAHAALELYAQAFEQVNALDRLEGFASIHGADFYGMPRNRDTVTLLRDTWVVPDRYRIGDQDLVPLCAGQPLNWRVDCG